MMQLVVPVSGFWKSITLAILGPFLFRISVIRFPFYVPPIFDLNLGVRLFHPCADNEKCDVYENPQVSRCGTLLADDLIVLFSASDSPRHGGTHPLPVSLTARYLFVVARAAAGGPITRDMITRRSSFSHLKTFTGIMACRSLSRF